MFVKVGAPGKVILCGEHAVVHGRTGIALSLGLRTYVTIRPGSETGFLLDLPDVSLSTLISVDDVKAFRTSGVDVLAPPPPLAQEMRESLQQRSASMPAAMGQAKVAFLYLAAHLLPDHPAAWSLSVSAKSMLPIGAGLGSSASFSTALVGALLLLRASFEPSLKDRVGRSHVNAWAFRAEQLTHGNPSGVDNHVATYGGAIAMRSGQVTNLKHVKAMDLLVTNTKVPRSTKELVALVGRRLAAHPAVMTHILDAVQAISDQVLHILEALPNETDSGPLLDQLQTLMAMNHGLLNAMGVGHAALDSICATTHAYGLATKLTGAGGGGCAITLLRNGAPVEEIQAKLKMAGFQCISSDVGVPGVTAYDDSGEIIQNAFLDS